MVTSFLWFVHMAYHKFWIQGCGHVTLACHDLCQLNLAGNGTNTMAMPIGNKQYRPYFNSWAEIFVLMQAMNWHIILYASIKVKQ